MGLELGRGGARWIDRSAGACAIVGRGEIRARGRSNDATTTTDAARARDRRRTGLRPRLHPAFPVPAVLRRAEHRVAGARLVVARGRASRECGADAGSFAGIARRWRGRCARVVVREGGKNRTNWEVPRSVAAQRARTSRASNALVAREEVFLRRGDSSASPSRAPPRSASVLAPPIVDRSSSRSIDRWPPRRREEERRNPIRSASGWRPRRSRRRPLRSRARRRDGRPPRAIPRASRRERPPQAPRLRPRRVFARRTSPAARSEAARRRPTRADSDSHPRRRPTSSASSSACAARAWTCTTLGSSTCARAKPRSESRSCSGISPGRGTTSTETARRDTLVRSR